jgi:uncharacterized protein YbbC (DUF1343 family)
MTQFTTWIISLFILSICSCGNSTHNQKLTQHQDTIEEEPLFKTGAEQTELYFPLLKEKKIGIVTNQTGIIGNMHLVDSLTSEGFEISTIFAPEHGFRGHAEAGEKVKSDIDEKTGIRIISLYGSYFKPAQKDLEGIDIMIFDIQDVGARFYTYISTMHYVMEACAEAGIPLIVLDRPNPNGFYVDGPLLDPAFKSFIGMHPIPIVHGMTVGELAMMINGEKWLENGITCKLTVIPMANYTHDMVYHLPIAPSPNLQSPQSIYLYPSLCLFEGTVMSVGRGTDTPFEIFGHPEFPAKEFSFTPVSKPGFSAAPLHMDKICFGLNLAKYADTLLLNPKLELKWVIMSYNLMPDKKNFFKSNMFDKLTGSSSIRNQIIEGLTEEEIRTTWQADLDEFKKKREQYLIY